MTKFDVRDLVGAVGLVQVGVGVAMVSVPAALVLVGLVFLGLAVLPPLIVAQRRRRDG